METSDGQLVTTLDVGAGYAPGSAISFGDGISASFTFGTISATDNDALQLHALADSDSTDVLVALGLNSLFEGSDAETIGLRNDIEANPDLLSTSSSGAAGDNGVILDLLALAEGPVEGLNTSVRGFFAAVVSDVGHQISVTNASLEIEQAVVGALVQRRGEIVGVNIDEELVAMIQFEQAFGAAAQFIQVINQLQDEVLNLL